MSPPPDGDASSAPFHGAPTSSAPASAPAEADWRIANPGPEHAIEGFADRTSMLPGQPVQLFVSTTADRFTVTAYRMGDYPPTGGRQVWKSTPQPGHEQPPAMVETPRNTVSAPWQPSLTVDTTDWEPGDYLFRLDGDNGAQQFVPLTVASPDNTGRIVIVNAVTTWQAYNRWGGDSLYTSRSGRFAERSRAVSFDRPYQAKDMQGAGDFLIFELPFVQFAEHSGMPLGYATDVDLHANSHLLDGARAMVTLGHDEYWSTAMREQATLARDGGVNLAFLGGNEVYRHIRFEPSPLGADRIEVGYKSFAQDPASQTDPMEATTEWRSAPFPRPESELLGNFYQCNPVEADMISADSESWLTSGVVTEGQRLPRLIGNEYERVDLRVPTPRPIQVLFHSPVTCQGKPDFADVTYYTTSSGAAVFSAGTQYWICGLDPSCSNGERYDPAVATITTRLLTAYAQGPAGREHPATDNLDRLGIR
ncbi:MAG: N,N-dimethylformamidase beta subunit family domain-containing protein [Pseudonocardiaceae bacterium]